MAEALVSEAQITYGAGGTTASVMHRLSRPANFFTDTIVGRATHLRPVNSEFISLVGAPGRIVVSGDVDATTASTLDRQIAVESRSGIAPLTIDLSEVTHLGSAGVSALAAARARARKQGGDCVLIAPPGSRRITCCHWSRYRLSAAMARSACLAVTHLTERHRAVGGVFPWEAQHPFTDDIARHLRGAAADGDVLPRQVSQPRLQAFTDFPYDTGNSRDRPCGVHIQGDGLGVEEPDERPGGRGQCAISDTVVDVLDQLLGHRPVHHCPAGHLVHAFVVGPARLLRKANVVNGIRASALTAAAAGELRALPDRPTFVIKLPRGHRPATVDVADHGVVADVHTVEELLAEFGGTAQHSDAPQRDSRMTDGHQEHGQPFVLGHVPVGAGQTQAVVGSERAGAPGLGAVDHPTVAAAFGTGED